MPKVLRQKLVDDGWRIGRPRIAQVFQSVDGTERYLVQAGAETVEAVWMPEGDEGESGDGTEAGARCAIHPGEFGRRIRSAASGGWSGRQ